MKYWNIVILEDSCGCWNCGRAIEFGKPAFILEDTSNPDGLAEEPVGTDSKPTGRAKGVLCLDCMREKFPEAVEGL